MNHFRITREVRNAWSTSSPLTAISMFMFVAFIASAAGIFLDHRIITGAPAWLKPAKFAISTSIFCGTLAWLYRYISVWPRFVRAMGWVVSVVVFLEVAIIDLQAARRTTSHFNVGTPLDAVLFGTMGAAIVVLWLASVGVLAALARQKFSNPAWGWWLRMAMLTTVVGTAAGGLMIRSTPAPIDAWDFTHPRNAGSHTVGAPDGGPGLPGVGWSTQHGDLRVPHFFGLHGLQILPILGSLILRRRSGATDRNQSSLAFAMSASYLAFIGILMWQALRGQSVIAPDSATSLALTVWLASTISIGVFLMRDTNLSRNAFVAQRRTI